MLSKLKKISKDLILYSVLTSEFEKLDFKNDALAGVRANYFNAKCSPQTEKTDVVINGRDYSLSYAMRQGEPLAWKITLDARPVQTVKRASDGGYCVMSYGDNGVIYKRQYFDGAHRWLRTEYYDPTLENCIAAVIDSAMVDGLVILRLQRFLPEGVETTELYPSLKAPKRRCTALIYSNSGMIWYDAAFKPAEVARQEPPEEEGGFRFSKEAFISAGSKDVLQLEEAPYLSEADVESGYVPPEVTVEEPEAYSAYDQIENILFEAHKTNKNIFGELAIQSRREVKDEPAEEEAAPEETPVEAPAEEAPAAEAEPVAEEPAAEEAPEPEKAEAKAEENAPEIAVKTEEEADSAIVTPNGVYAYYGALDENQKRSGRGRTVTPDGLTAYEGDYLADKRHGFGVCYYKEGSPNYVGDWKLGDRDGRGVGFRLSDGTMHVGKWSQNKPDGFGARFDKDGNFLDVGTYVGGKRNGKSVSFDEDGNIVVKMWKDGEPVSEKIISD